MILSNILRSYLALYHSAVITAKPMTGRHFFNLKFCKNCFRSKLNVWFVQSAWILFRLEIFNLISSSPSWLANVAQKSGSFHSCHVIKAHNNDFHLGFNCTVDISKHFVVFAWFRKNVCAGLRHISCIRLKYRIPKACLLSTMITLLHAMSPLACCPAGYGQSTITRWLSGIHYHTFLCQLQFLLCGHRHLQNESWTYSMRIRMFTYVAI